METVPGIFMKPPQNHGYLSFHFRGGEYPVVRTLFSHRSYPAAKAVPVRTTVSDMFCCSYCTALKKRFCNMRRPYFNCKALLTRHSFHSISINHSMFSTHFSHSAFRCDFLSLHSEECSVSAPAGITDNYYQFMLMSSAITNFIIIAIVQMRCTTAGFCCRIDETGCPG